MIGILRDERGGVILIRWWRPIVAALAATSVSLAGAEALLRWQDVADPPAFERNPHYGYLMQPNQLISTRGHRFRINDAGLRGADFSVAKPNGLFRLVFLGESVTYGGGSIQDQDLFVNRVASALASSERRPVEAVNLSAPGWGIQNMSAYVAVKGVHDADLLIWVISSVDFRRPLTSLEENHFLERKPWSRLMYAASSISRIAHEPFPNYFMERKPWSYLMHAGFSISRIARGPSPNHAGAGSDDALRQNVEIFRRTLERIRTDNTACAVVVVPAADRYAGFLDDRSQFRAAAESLSVPFLDVGPVVEGRSPEEVFLDRVHLSRRGHEVVAAAMVPFLRENMLQRAHERGKRV